MDDFIYDLPQGLTTQGYLGLGIALRGTLTTYTSFVVGSPTYTLIERDWYRMSLSAGESYLITLQSSAAGAGRTGLGDPVIVIYDENGVVVASNDNANPLTTNAAITFVPPSTGSYYVEVRAAVESRSIFSAAPPLQPGDYLLRLSRTGEPAPDIPPQLVIGTEAADSLAGNSLFEIYLLGGNDTVAGASPIQLPNPIGGGFITLPGRDTVFAGAGNDSIFGNGDDDSLFGNSGSDTIYGGEGDDFIYGDGLYFDTDADFLYGGNGNDWITGGGGDVIGGGDGNDVLFALSGNNRIWGGYGEDTINSLGGSDTIYGGPGRNVLNGGGGNDLIQAGDDGDYLDGGTGVNTIRGGAGDDTIGYNLSENAVNNIGGGAGNDRISTPMGGNHTIWGGLGNDTVSGNSGNDLIYGGPGNDSLAGHQGNDSIYGGNDASFLSGGIGNDLIRGGDGSDTIDGGPGNDNIGGGGGNDIINCWEGTNTVWGGLGNDTIHAGTGKDVIYGGPGADRFVFASASHIGIGLGRDVIMDFTSGVDKIDLSGFGLIFNGTAGLVGAGVASF